MQNEVLIKVENLGKSYLIGHEMGNGRGQESFREAVGRQVRRVARVALDISRGRQIIQGDKIEEFWALNDVSFEVKRGEVLGIIGRNGAGKSTLLKILSRITEPTRGRATIKGRVASLLEVGTGFHQDLTGRENIYLNGAILGMSRAEIKSKFDEIVDFAEIEKFLDTPVKRYSSGMYVRLAFAVAAHLEPEILIIDEVLAVGDVVFQKKCLGKMQTAANSGRTVLFVSHNMQTVAGLTERAILLQSGRIAAIGRSAEIIEQYLAEQGPTNTIYERPASGTHPEITRVELHTSRSGQLQQFGKPMAIDIEIYAPELVPNAAVSFQIMTSRHQPVVHVLNLDKEVPMLRSAGTHRLRCLFPKLRLYPGNYYLNFYLGSSEPRRVFEAPHQICPFEVAVLDEIREFYWYPDNALYVEDVQWTSQVVAPDSASGKPVLQAHSGPQD
ncbi:MAG TPA: ABC transporter ATP-binding protein [Candidatus Acidoferrum sp.]|nr:ABC transporter ATP-binding protein [Candidatus Acidoferrum sp.]